MTGASPSDGGSAPHAPRDLTCNACSFNLVGLPRDALCPECGAPIARSLAGGGLANDAPSYLNALRRGCNLLVVATIVRGVSLVATFALLAALAELSPAAMTRAPWLFDVFGVPTLLITLFATWTFTTPHPRLSRDERWWSSRRLARSAMACELALVLTRLILAQFGVTAQFTPGMSTAGYVQSGIAGLVYVGVQAAWIVGFLATLRYAARVASRIPDDALRRSAMRLQWLLPLLSVVGIAIFLLGPIAALVLFGRHFRRLSRRIAEVLNPHSASTYPARP